MTWSNLLLNYFLLKQQRQKVTKLKLREKKHEFQKQLKAKISKNSFIGDQEKHFTEAQKLLDDFINQISIDYTNKEQVSLIKEIRNN